MTQRSGRRQGQLDAGINALQMGSSHLPFDVELKPAERMAQLVDVGKYLVYGILAEPSTDPSALEEIPLETAHPCNSGDLLTGVEAVRSNPLADGRVEVKSLESRFSRLFDAHRTSPSLGDKCSLDRPDNSASNPSPTRGQPHGRRSLGDGGAWTTVSSCQTTSRSCCSTSAACSSRSPASMRLIEDWGLAITPQEFLDSFGSWATTPIAGAEELVAEVATIVPVGCLSNTNAVHWNTHLVHWPLIGLFQHTFLSFQTGCVKPDQDAFEQVVATLGVRPERILFLDDNVLNVEAALAAGIRAFHARGVDTARAQLVSAGILRDAARRRRLFTQAASWHREPRLRCPSDEPDPERSSPQRANR